MNKQRIFSIMMVVFALLFLLSAGMLLAYYGEGMRQQQAFRALERITEQADDWGGETSETAAVQTELPQRKKRCVIPATGFYEWDTAKHKYFFQMPGQPIYLAGIYDTINGVNCFIILTTAPNDSVAPIHDRMPLLLSHEQVRPWLVDAGAALELLCSRPPLLLRTSCDGQLGFDDLA